LKTVSVQILKIGIGGTNEK